MVPDRPRRREYTLAAQFLVLQLTVVAALLLIVGVVGVRQSTETFSSERGSVMRRVAENVANLPAVRKQLTIDSRTPMDPAALARVLAPFVDSGLNLSSASDVYLVSTDGTVIAATDPSLVGRPADLGGSDALRGRGWVGEVDHGDAPDDGLGDVRVVAGHAPLIANDGTLLAVVVSEETYPSVWQRLTGSATNLPLYLGLGALLGIVGTYVVSRVVKRRTRGLAPTELANLADHREALLHSIREGVVAVDTDDRVTMMNDAARVTLGMTSDPVGQRVDALGLDPHVVDLLAGDEGRAAAEVADAVALVGSRVVVFNRRAASSRGRGIGSITTLRDRTELVSLQSQLSSNLSITDTLRAQTHEFDNQLHTISGLVQLGEYDEVRTLVGTITRHRSEIGDYVSARIADPAVAALMIAKDSVAVERGVELVLDGGSRLPTLRPDESADLTTVLGNLVDNAIDACAALPDALVEVWVTVAGTVLHVRVRDNGPGVPDDLREAVFVRGFSTKPDVLGGRGIGLPLVQLICAQRGGSVEVGRADEEGGAEFVVSLPLGRDVDLPWQGGPS